MSEAPPRSALLPDEETEEGASRRADAPAAELRLPRSLVLAAAVSWRLLVVGAAVYLTVTVLARIQVIVVPAAVALLLACALWPAVRWLRARGARPLVAAAATLLGLLGSLALVLAL
ncbi:MAG: hypothetical protein NZL88_09940, partial [Gaiellaceae bacterium]|nr:hypothetical protein [Gaiellaceae bacterium]